MKKLLFAFMLVCSTAYADDKVYVFTDYNPVRVFQLVDGKDVEFEANKAGLRGAYKEMDRSELPNEREYRDAWKVSKGAIEVDETLKSSIDANGTKRQNLIDKLKALGFTDEESITLIGG